jgi:hypothetical protein
MNTFTYGKIEKLYNSLIKHGVSANIINEIVDGGKEIGKTTKPEKKAEWFRNAMDKMDRLLPEDKCRAIREDCACCLGGEKQKLTRRIVKDNNSLEDRIAVANKTWLVFGKGVKREDDGTLTVTFFDEGLEAYNCVCLRKTIAPISGTYCFCCGGHIKYHLQNALDLKLSCRLISSALSSGGKLNCKFSYTII